MEERVPYTPKERKKWTFRLSAIEGVFWFSFAAINYLTVYLEHLGFSVSEASLIQSIGSGISIVSTPLGGTFADKLRSSRRALNIFLILAIITTALIPLTSNIKLLGIPVCILFVEIGIFFRAPTSTLMETTVINGCSNSGSFYGFVRIWGSLLYVVMNLILGAVIVEKNSYLTFYIFSLTMIPVIFFANSVTEITDVGSANKKPMKFREMPFGKLFSNPYFIAYMVFCILNYIPQNTIGAFLPYLLKDIGSNMGYIGYLQAYRAIFEVPLLLLSGWLVKRMSYRTMVIMSALFWALQALFSYTVNSFGMMILVMTLSGIASGFTQAGSIRFILSLAPPELQATAQTLVSSTTAIAGIFGHIIGGLLLETMNIKDYYVVCGIVMMIIIGLYALSFIFIRKVLKKEFVDMSRTY